MARLADRFTIWALRLIATGMLFAGVSVFVAAVPAFGLLADSPVAKAIAGILFQIGGAFVIAGAVAVYLSRSRRPQLPNERETTSDAGRPALGGWLLVLPIVLIVLPVWLVLRLQPFLAEWRRVVDLLASSRIWEGANANMSGVVLLPLAGALVPPFLELLTMGAFMIAPLLLLFPLLSRSERFPRIYLVSVVLLSALVIASVLGASAAMRAGEAVQQLIDGSARPGEADPLTEFLGRYTSAVSSTAPVLVRAWCGYLVWLPALIFSRRARTTFAGRGAPL